ncbi:MAG: hypothetical protein K2J18_09145, partial [Paramuribaculum sp.]|nr:hypothetical protein [Paramuribaculum sp.]
MKDYYLEYLEELERSLKEDMARLDERTLMAGPYSMRRPLLNYLWCSMLKGRDEYNTLRQAGATRAEAIAGSRLGEIRIGREFKRQVAEMREHPWYKALRGLRGRTVFFCSGKRNVEYMRPVIERYGG